MSDGIRDWVRERDRRAAQIAAVPADTLPNQEWRRACFDLQQSNIQWAKGQSWNSVQWSLLLFGAIFAVKGSAPEWLLGAYIGLIVLANFGWQIGLHCFAKSSRDWSEALAASVRDYLPPRRHTNPDHIELLVARILAIVGAAGLTLAHLTSH